MSAMNLLFAREAWLEFVAVSKMLFAACRTTVDKSLRGNITARNPIINKMGDRNIHPRNHPNEEYSTRSAVREPNWIPQNFEAKAPARSAGDSCSSTLSSR